MSYRDRLFERYNEVQVSQLDTDDETKRKWFETHYDAHYAKHFNELPRDISILEVGCNRGYLASVLVEDGFEDVTGIDLSPVDVEAARELVPEATFVEDDAVSYLEQTGNTYDVIVMKAVLEHLPKDQVLPMLECLYNSLKTKGFLLVEVPNMNWLYASHERYLDFTHETGFTNNSLGQIMRTVFNNVTVESLENQPLFESTRSEIKHAVARRILNWLFKHALADNLGEDLWCRSVMAKGTNRSEG